MPGMKADICKFAEQNTDHILSQRDLFTDRNYDGGVWRPNITSEVEMTPEEKRVFDAADEYIDSLK